MIYYFIKINNLPIVYPILDFSSIYFEDYLILENNIIKLILKGHFACKLVYKK